MPVKLIENAQKKGPSETGVKIIKNVTPHQGLMVLYREPKKVNVRRWFRKTFTWDVEVWVAKTFFNKSGPAQSHFTQNTFYYGCVKEKHTSLWVSNNAISRKNDVEFFSIDEMIEIRKREIKKGEKDYGEVVVTVDVPLMKHHIFVTEPQSSMNTSTEAPNKTDLYTLLEFYNTYNTKDENIVLNEGDGLRFK